jgi:hypothetical protein
MRRPTDQVLRGLKMMADYFDVELPKFSSDMINHASRRDVLAAVRWAWRMNAVRGLRADIRAARAPRPAGAPWDPQLALPGYAPKKRRRATQ